MRFFLGSRKKPLRKKPLPPESRKKPPKAYEKNRFPRAKILESILRMKKNRLRPMKKNRFPRLPKKKNRAQGKKPVEKIFPALRAGV